MARNDTRVKECVRVREKRKTIDAESSVYVGKGYHRCRDTLIGDPPAEVPHEINPDGGNQNVLKGPSHQVVLHASLSDAGGANDHHLDALGNGPRQAGSRTKAAVAANTIFGLADAVR